MESRKSMVHKRLDSIVHNSPTSSSPLRKKSIVQNTPSSALSENDDEAERIARRREISTSTPLSITKSTNRRHSLGLGFLANIPAPQMAESINQCIKLSAENKINIKNAFSLEMIDFMTYMIKKQDANMSNLQVASTSLDVSTKIYGFRVDNLHMEILKIVGGLDKQAPDDTEPNLDEQGEGPQEDAEANVKVLKKKKKKSKQKIFNTVEALKGNVEIAKPMAMMGEGDLQTSDMLYQAMLPNHANSGFYQQPYNDVIIDIAEIKSDLQNNLDTKYGIPVIEDLSNLEICTSYSNFEFLGWSVEDEPEEMSVNEEAEHNDESGNRFQFDLDASVEHDDDNPAPEPMNYFDIEHDDDDNNIHECYQKAVNRPNENIVNAHDNSIRIPATITPEYSFVQPRVTLHWAGPSHWKFRNFAKSSAPIAPTGSTKVMGTCMQAPLRKRKQLELLYDEKRDVIDAKFAPSASTKLQFKTVKTEWNTENLTLPEDVHYDIAQMTKLYLHLELVLKPTNGDKEDGGDKVTAADVSDGEGYDYNNPNDTSEYCPNVSNNDGYDDGGKDEDCNFEDVAELASQGLTGDNLVAAPKLANKIPIAYCRRPKKIDMRQLKKSMWNCLKSTDNNADITDVSKDAMEQNETSTKESMKEDKQFSDVYKMLPKLLTKTNAEALSVPISFISLLHLANEKGLELHSLPNMSDIIIKKS